MISESEWRQIDDVVFDIYQAENVRDLRLRFLERMKQLVPHEISVFDLKGRRRGRDVFFDPVTTTIEKKALDSYYDEFIEKDYTSWATSQMGDIVAYRDSDFISDGMRQKSEFYQTWMRPMGVVYGCGINVFSHGVGFATVTFARDEGEGDFTDKELDILSVTARHLGEKFHQLYPVGVSYRGRGGSLENFNELYGLTAREAEICEMVCSGLLPAEIAASLTISTSTVNRHLANIYQKTGAGNRSTLLRKALRSLGKDAVFD